MPIVIQRRREPNGWEQLGLGVQRAVDKYLQGNIAMADQSSRHARDIMGIGMMGSRMKREERMDAQAAQKDTARAKAGEVMGGIDFKSPDAAQQLLRLSVEAPDLVGPSLQYLQQQRQFEASERARAASEARHYASLNKPQLATVQGPYGPEQVLFYPATGKTAPLQGTGAQNTADGMGGNAPALPSVGGSVGGGQTLPAGGAPVYDPEFPPAQEQPMQSPTFDINQMAQDFMRKKNEEKERNTQAQMNVLSKFGAQVPPQYAQQSPAVQQPASQPSLARQQIDALAAQGINLMPQEQGKYKPGDVIDASGKVVQVPAGIPWEDPKEVVLGNTKYSAQINKRSGLFRILGVSAPSAAERKDAKYLEKMDMQEKQKNTSADIVLEDIDRALDLSNGWSTGKTGAVLSVIPATDAHDLDNILLGIGGNISLDKLQQMRASSPTGGALGSVTEGEHKLLRSVFGSLQQSQSKEQFDYNLTRLKKVYSKIIHGEGAEGSTSTPAKQRPLSDY